MPLDDKMIEALRADFGDAAVQVRKTVRNSETGEPKYLVGYKPQYITERLNDVFGHENWDFDIREFGKEGNEVWVLGKLTIYLSKIENDKDPIMDGPIVRKVLCNKSQFGTSKVVKADEKAKDSTYEMNLGDAYKSAATDSLGKCASMLDIGHKAYKGIVEYTTNGSKEVKKMVEDKSRDESLAKLLALCKEHSVNKSAFKVLVKNALKFDKAVEDLSNEDIEKLIKHLETHKAPF
jgi:hypothetical protein